MKEKGKTIIYQTLPRLFGNFNADLTRNGGIGENGCGKFVSYTAKALSQIKNLGVSHVWFTGVIAHATQTDYSSYGIPKDHNAVVKGKAGSPYAVKDYYDVDPDLAVSVGNRMQEFEELVARTHQAGLKVIIDFVPNHVARTYHSNMKPLYVDDLGQRDRTDCAFLPGNNFYYMPGQPLELHFGAKEEDYEYSEFPAKATGNDCFTPAPNRNDWYETVKLNYGIDYKDGGTTHFSPIPDTWRKMLDILLFWIGKGIDGFRCDMAEMVPIEFWEWVVPRVKSRKNVLFIAEVYRPDLYRSFIHRGNFDYLYDKVGVYDSLRRVIRHEATVADFISPWNKIEDIRDNMLFFLENHDEQRIASGFFAGNPFAAVPALLLVATIYSNPVMIYNGQELGEKGMDEEGFSGCDGRTSIFDYWSMESMRKWANDGLFDGGQLDDNQMNLRDVYRKILTAARNVSALSEGGFYGLSYCNDFKGKNIIAYLRALGKEVVLAAVNFDDREREVCINLPQNAFDVLHIPDNAVAKVSDLLEKKDGIGTLTAKCPYRLTLPPLMGKLLKFDFNL